MTYIARDCGGEAPLLQYLVWFPTAVFEPRQPPVSWWAGFRRVAGQLVASPGIDFAVRFAIRERRLERLLMVLGPPEHEAEIVSLGAAFSGLNAIIADSVDVPLDREAHHRVAEAFPAVRARVEQDAYVHDGVRLIDDVRLGPELGQLLDLALTRGWDFAYQLNACHHHADRDELRWSRYNLLHVTEAAGLPLRVREVQERAIGRVERAAFLVEEFVGCDAIDAMKWFDEVIANGLDRPRGFPASVLAPAPGDDVEKRLALGLHSARVERFEPWRNVAAAALPGEVLQVLDWRPPDALMQAIRNPARGAKSEADYLRRIEERLIAIEQELARRQVAGQPPAYVEFRTALDHAKVKPEDSLMNARRLLEGIVSTIYLHRYKAKKTLEHMIDELVKSGSIFPKNISTYLHTVRVLGNMMTHKNPMEIRGQQVSSVDVEVALLALLQVVEWYVLEYRPLPAD